MRILLVESEPAPAHAIGTVLKAHCSAMVDTIDTGEEALEMVRHYDYDAVILSMTLRDMDGLDVLRRMRIGQTHTPVLLLTSLSQSHAKVRAFNLGADDVVDKRFDNDELAARVQAIVRRRNGHSQQRLRLGPLCLDLSTHEVTVDGEPVRLTPKEYAVLQLMVLRKGMTISKDIFLNHLYGGVDEPDAKIIDIYICKLRKKLAAAGADDVIETVWGRGYVAPVPKTWAGREDALATGPVSKWSARSQPLPVISGHAAKTEINKPGETCLALIAG